MAKSCSGVTGMVVGSRSRHDSRGWLTIAGRTLPVALGRAGRRVLKREGDGATPVGVWRLRCVLYRADRGQRPRTALPVRPLRRDDGWCDAVGDRAYNRAVRLPYPASAEALWRADAVYDVVVVLSHNEQPRTWGGGSAIFMHLARPGFTPTEGCIALTRRDLGMVLARCGRGTRVRVTV